MFLDNQNIVEKLTYNWCHACAVDGSSQQCSIICIRNFP